MHQFFLKTSVAVIFSVALVCSAVLPSQAQPAKIYEGVNAVSQTAYGKGIGKDNAEVELNKRIAFFIKIVLSFVGVVMLAVVIYAGYLWLTAGGNQEQVTTAKKWIFNAVIGVIIVAAAYYITDFALEAAVESGNPLSQ